MVLESISKSFLIVHMHHNNGHGCIKLVGSIDKGGHDCKIFHTQIIKHPPVLDTPLKQVVSITHNLRVTSQLLFASLHVAPVRCTVHATL